MLDFANVTKEFRLDEDNSISPVRDVSVNIGRGELVVIVGRSGTGKTTLLNLAAGLIRPTRGQVVIDDRDVSRMSDRAVSSLRSRKIGFVFQFPSLLPSLTVGENVALPAIFNREPGRADNARARVRAKELLDRLGVGGKMDVYPRQLSAGEQKRVVIARSLINEPQLILADEPTSDLDSKTEAEVISILSEINSQGVTFLIVTHSLEWTEIASRSFEMEAGKLNQIN